ncbi:MAG: SbcC/MukB-like Walker B domain-containing protein [Streptosporangiaceae bacterium]
MIRFKPVRAGIINLWDYFDEEFAFADGRLALRGHNGSGKTKALEVLFPFVLDGSLDARRLDPFSGENRTMKANLLYRGQDSEHGYVWMEFARPGETVTLVVGLTAHKNMDRPRPSFYVTGKRMGIDFGLLSADSRPLTAKQLTAILGRDAHYGDKRGAYQDAVDARLFGLGRERYAQLLDLLIALRRPLLAKDLDPGKVSETLTAGLSPVDDELVTQAARDFENLAAVQKQYDDLAAADVAVRAFLDQYVAYLRVHTRHELDLLAARMSAAAGFLAAIGNAARGVSRADSQEQWWRQAETGAKMRMETCQARLFALRDRDGYKDHEKLALRRGHLEQEKRDLAAEQARLARARANVADLAAEAARVADRLAEVERAADRHARRLAETADSSGISRDGSAADTGDDLPVTAKARAAARRDDIREVRGHLAHVRDAERDRDGAESALGTARQSMETWETSCRAAGDRLATARTDLSAQLEAWTGRWIGDEPYAAITAGQAELLAAALDGIGSPDAPSLAELFGTLTAERGRALTAQGQRLRTRHADLGEAADRLAREREAIAGERDDGPPASDLRPADRAERAGAPLWRLADFRPGVDAGTAAAIEGALYGAGLLTAWVHPDPSLTMAAVGAGEADGYLVALPPAARRAGRTLADVLVPEQQDMVAPELVGAVLASIALAESIPADSVLAESIPSGAEGGPVVTTRAQFSYGSHLGARPKPAPEFIGATNRAARRRLRLAELDRQLAEIERQRGELGTELGLVADALANSELARRELPRTAPVLDARQKVSEAAAHLAAASARLDEAKTALDGKIAELDARTRRLRRSAADRDMPVSPDEVNAVERAVAEFDRAATDLVRARGDTADLGTDLTGRRDRIGRLGRENDEAAELLGERQAGYLAGDTELRVLEQASGAEYEQVSAEIAETDGALRAAKAEQKTAGDNAATEHDKLVAGRRDLQRGGETLAVATSELFAQAAVFAPYAHGDLRPLLGITETAPWPGASSWPDPGQAAAALSGQALPTEADPVEAIRAILPAGVTALLDAYTAATKGGRVNTDGVRQNAVDRMWSAYREFENALKAGEDGYQADLTGSSPFIVEVTTNEGRKSAAAFARKIAEDVENQGVLLEERERTVLEDSLLTALAQQIHSRVLAAKDLVAAMDADTRSKPMSSGMAIGISWVRSDRRTEQQASVSRMLDRDAAGLGADGLAELRAQLRAMIHDHRAGNPRDTYREVLAAVLDYRSWHAFELQLLSPGSPPQRLTRKKHSEMSGGEKSAAIHMPLFAAANALYLSSKPTCPRLVALDEAFAGIDDKFKPELLGLTVKFDLDLFMTGHDLWVNYPTVPLIAHYDMQHDKASHALSALLVLWDGEQLIDADAGYAGNEDLAAELLGFRPTRHVPAEAGGTLVIAAEEDLDEDHDAD